MPYVVDKETINEVPIHDAIIGTIKIYKPDKDNTMVEFCVKLDKREVEDLTEDLRANIHRDGNCRLIIEDCKSITVKMYCMNIGMDALDYIDIEPTGVGDNLYKIVMTTGSVLECIAAKSFLIK